MSLHQYLPRTLLLSLLSPRPALLSLFPNSFLSAPCSCIPSTSHLANPNSRVPLGPRSQSSPRPVPAPSTHSRVLAASPSPLNAPLPPSMHRDLETTVPHELCSCSTSLRRRHSRTQSAHYSHFPLPGVPAPSIFPRRPVQLPSARHLAPPCAHTHPFPLILPLSSASPHCPRFSSPSSSSPLPPFPRFSSLLPAYHLSLSPSHRTRFPSLTLRQYLHTLILILILVLLRTSSPAPAQLVSLRISSLLVPAHRLSAQELRNTKPARATRDSASAPRSSPIPNPRRALPAHLRVASSRNPHQILLPSVPSSLIFTSPANPDSRYRPLLLVLVKNARSSFLAVDVLLFAINVNIVIVILPTPSLRALRAVPFTL
ncbi:hypothetical protein C8R44DRAFT_881745 [Mycena epipterygia]|nr:hypothetical protein C8R44DRAFT_881745 [Mycena epipterygia]